MAEADAATASVIAVLRTSLTRPAQRTSSRDTLIGASAPVIPALQRGILGAQSRRCPTPDAFLSRRLHNLPLPSAGGVTRTPAIYPSPAPREREGPIAQRWEGEGASKACSGIAPGARRASARRRRLNRRGAVGAASRAERDRRDAIRAFLGGWRLGRLGRLPRQPVHLLHQEEHREGDDDEIENRVDEEAIVEGRGARRLGFRERGIMRARQVEKEIREVDTPEQQPQ